MILKDKTVLITGGSKGIGRACVEAFAKNGANVIINYAHDERAARDTARASAEHGVQILVAQANIAIPQQVDAMFRKIGEKFQAIDILVNNAGVFSEYDCPDNPAVIQEIFATNFFGHIRVINAARRLMGSGKVILISSIYGKLGSGYPNAIGYSASKAALDSYTKNLAKALAPDILVNALAPGGMLIPMPGETTENENIMQMANPLINRWTNASEIADGVIFLAKNDAVCGELLVIDGGMSLKVCG